MNMTNFRKAYEAMQTFAGTIAGARTFTGAIISSAAATFTGVFTSSGGAAFTGDAITGVVCCKTVPFVENGSTTYTGTVEIPAGATLLDVQVVNRVPWDDTGACTMIVGDDNDDNGWFAATDLKATDLVVGEVYSIASSENWGAKQGAYLVAATGRKGRVTAGVDSGNYMGAATEVIGKITTANQNGTAGRTHMTVFYAVGEVVSPTQI